jgi:anion-transporting  ArsA/GET3 family ATPase
MGLADIASFTVENTTIAVEDVTASVVVSVEPAMEIQVTTETTVGPVLTEIVTGPQGPPGAQNLYVQAADPSKDENGNTIWGAAETNYIWIPA